MANITPECWRRYLECMNKARDEYFNPCMDDSKRRYGQYGTPNFDYEKYIMNNELCKVAAQARYNNCTDELDRCADRSPTEKPRLEDPQKQRLRTNGSTIQSGSGVIIGLGITITFAAAVPSLPHPWRLAAMGLGVTAIGTGLFVYSAYQIAKADDDPIDDNFTSLARPRPPTPFWVKETPGTAINADVADAINAVLENQAKAVGFDRAIMTSLDRADGAAAAHEHAFEKLQMKHARAYASKFANELSKGADLRSECTHKMRQNDIRFSISEDDAYEIRRFLLEDERAKSTVKMVIRRYFRNASERRGALLQFISCLSDVHQFEISFPHILSTPKLETAERDIASVLLEFSESTYVHL